MQARTAGNCHSIASDPLARQSPWGKQGKQSDHPSHWPVAHSVKIVSAGDQKLPQNHQRQCQHVDEPDVGIVGHHCMQGRQANRQQDSHEAAFRPT